MYDQSFGDCTFLEEITFKGNYTGTLKTTFDILKLSIASANVNPASDVNTGVVVRYQTEYAYTGNPIVPDVVIYNNGEKAKYIK